MELTFMVRNDGTPKRRQTRRACNSCRHRKKRCYHDIPPDQSGVGSSSPDIAAVGDSQSPVSRGSRRDPVVRSRSASPRDGRGLDISQRTVERQDEGPGRPGAGRAADVEESHRFACDSNPMATLMEQTESRLQRGPSQKGDVGAWLDVEGNTTNQGEAVGFSSQRASDGHVDTDKLPPNECQEALVDIYFHRIHPILPLLDEDKVRAQQKDGSIPLRLLQVICLVAAKDSNAAVWLCLGSRANQLPLDKFSNILYSDVMQSISRRSEKKVLAIQILALLSLHEWGPTGAEDCSLNLAQAIHDAQTIGLHLRRRGSSSDALPARLFWCLWSLDRWNAAMNGRPLMIHDDDLGQGVDDVVSGFQSPFRVWLRIADKLGEVIHFYRPMMRRVDHSEVDLPCFEELVEQCDALDMAPEFLVSLEFLYHSVIILSTHSSGLQGRSRPRTSKIRQNDSILTIVSLSRNQDIGDYLPVPMIGYTISLAFSITYKQLRNSKLPSARDTAISQLRHLHECLKKLGCTWWSAVVMTRLSQRVLNNIQPTADPERSTGSETHITRSNSRPGVNRISPRYITSNGDLQSHLGADRMQMARHTDNGYQPAHSLAEGPLGVDEHSGVAEMYSTPFMTQTGFEDFDAFFGNFLDVSYPSCSNDPFLLGLDLPDFEFAENLG
ncbi:uncharacterized protein N7515_008683 [Penicillium bovifimosum]|uniref:Xylanolytic transcriptional activator regulatory domain-containing protein n=1 Tax=Penicillium bovifimosum TaxID=126998 RepID=A0A9W9GNR5_9EURO|nr:uncharacterized protein N7515_008683 [Penicillium bovifimosum]KAJ5124858.1 hypothetical protein N7515_008683 [Penicillium bovifimosum]